MSSPADELSPDALARVDQFFEIRARWASTHDLAGPRALADRSRDLLDAAAVLRVLRPDLALVDVGAGGGVPGLLLAAIAPEREVILIEPRVKRVAFLRSAAYSLGLPVQVERARWPIPLSGAVQVVSRAVVSPNDWPALAVEGGESVRAVIRMLARQRPAPDVEDLVLADALDYRDGEVALRVERWDRKD